MTASDLITDIFSRPAWRGMEGNVRRLTPRQRAELLRLIDIDPEGEAVRRGAPGSVVWMPSGRYKYVVTEDPTGGDKHTLTRLSNIGASGCGSLF